MNKAFITLIAVTTLIVTSFNAGQARAADSEDVAKLIIGATALFALGHAIKEAEDKKDRREAARPAPAPKPSPKPHTPYRDRDDRWKPNQNGRQLPVACLGTYRGKDGTYRGYSRSCLRQNYRHEAALPQACVNKVHTYQSGKRNIYDPSCLRRYGYWHQASRH